MAKKKATQKKVVKGANPENFGFFLPVAEFKIEEDSEGKRYIAYQKRWPSIALRNLAHDLLERSPDADKEKEEDDYSDLVPVVLLLVASLECFLNDMFISLARNDYGKEYRQVAEGFLGGSIRARLTRLIPLASRGRKCLDMGHHNIGLILKLIKTRNELAHTVEHYIEYPPQELDENVPLGKALTYDECRRYADALDSLFGAVLSGIHVLKGKTPWTHALVVDGRREQVGRK